MVSGLQAKAQAFNVLNICISNYPGNRNAVVTQLIIRSQLMFYFGIIQVICYCFTGQWEGSVLPSSYLSIWAECRYLSIQCHISNNCVSFEISYWHRNCIDALYTFSDESYFVTNVFWWNKYIYIYVCGEMNAVILCECSKFYI